MNNEFHMNIVLIGSLALNRCTLRARDTKTVTARLTLGRLRAMGRILIVLLPWIVARIGIAPYTE